MAKHRTHSIEFKRQVAQEFLAGETLHGSPSATAAATGRGGPNRRHERIQLMGRVGRPLLRHALGLSRPRARQDRTQGAHTRGREGSDRSRRSRQTVEIGRDQLRSSRPEGEPCSGLARPSARSRPRSPRRRPRRRPNDRPPLEHWARPCNQSRRRPQRARSDPQTRLPAPGTSRSVRRARR